MTWQAAGKRRDWRTFTAFSQRQRRAWASPSRSSAYDVGRRCRRVAAHGEALGWACDHCHTVHTVDV